MDEKLTLTEASEMLTIGEIRTIERHYGKHFDGDDLSGNDQLSAVIWAMERRKPRPPESKPYSWADVDTMTMKEASNYFAPEPVEADESDPESEAGKDGSLDER